MLVQFRYSVMNSQFSSPIDVRKGESLDSIKGSIFADYCNTWRHAPSQTFRSITIWKEVTPPVYDDLYAIVKEAVEEQIDTGEKFFAALKTVQAFNVHFRPAQERIQSRL